MAKLGPVTPSLLISLARMGALSNTPIGGSGGQVLYFKTPVSWAGVKGMENLPENVRKALENAQKVANGAAGSKGDERNKGIYIATYSDGTQKILTGRAAKAGFAGTLKKKLGRPHVVHLSSKYPSARAAQKVLAAI